MKVAGLLVAAAACAASVSIALAQEPAPTPLPDSPPVGEFSVVPASGPVGTLVTVSGEFDKDITGVRFRCIYHDTFDEGLVEAYRLPQPSRSFSFEFEIPATLSLRQRGGATRPTLIGECEFLAMAGHQLLTASVPFTVTVRSGVTFPSTGNQASASGSASLILPAAVLVAVAGAGLFGAGMLRRRATASAERDAVGRPFP